MFDRLSGILRPWQAYRDVIRCQHLIHQSINGTVLYSLPKTRCHERVFPGTLYCRNHCRDQLISICPSCQARPIKALDHSLITWNEKFGAIINWPVDPFSKVKRFCHTCETTEAWKKECCNSRVCSNVYFSDCEYQKEQCGFKRAPGETYCPNCLSRDKSTSS